MMTVMYDRLKLAGLNPHYIGQHKGLCKKPYVIIRTDGILTNIYSDRIGQELIDFILLVPEYDYLEVDRYKKRVRAALKDLKFLRNTNGETPVITDDEKQALTMSMQYTILKKLEG